MNIKEKLQLYLVMGSTNCEQDPVHVLQQAILGGVSMFQFREKGTDSLQGEEKIRLARQLQAVCREYQVPFIVNDDVDLALFIEADGIHIGQEDEAIETVKDKFAHKVVGVSCHNLDEAKIAIRHGVDYIGVGPMYPTLTKLDTRNVVGPSLIKSLREADLTIPTVGIGGIDQSNARAVVKAGSNGIAVISAISKADDPKLAAELLKTSLY
ncbi:thiamine-phosphate pyrophosphorylase [Bacillus mesophilus]|uniref:Thiamine-phosphate synthase n=1 Tax=Bacillus mesophilus TaxID=1808955 RepID=A0A6M0Q6W1_9BACI|nr:thiamine phosphate synthase [Bacillus mesophilus]MBM7659977.1 thiamine-phosphate pyrophosphorylase [Bacillus mesophilus]NEY70838.1 thiamine phosphate synthase [Bacillus mesophilus]